MTPERWKKVNRLFQSALDLSPGKRGAFLDDECRDDRSLRDQVEALLAANEEAGEFMSGNAARDMEHLIADDNDDLAGSKIGHYDVISVLGKGGMGKVYLARDSRLNRNVAIKTLPRAMSGSDDYFKRFRTEAKAAANINHPNVATVYSVEETEEHRIFITMEHVEGKPLGEMIPHGGVDLRTFLDWFIPIANALAAAHEKGVIHRDIKPGNIMITPSGAPKILDFGLARIERTDLTENASTLTLTKTGQILGTPAYMSPEQAEGREIDKRSDIFSLAVVMYEALTGKRPFEGDNYASIVSKLLTVEPRNVSELKPDVPYLLSRLVMKCLSKEPRRRYQSMNEVRVILEEIDTAVSSGSSLPSSARPSMFAARKSFAVPALAALSVIFLVAAAFFAWQWLSASGRGDGQIVRFSVDPPPGQELSLFETAISPDGRKLVFATRRNSLKTLHVRHLDDTDMVPLEGTEEARNPFFSPDGEWIGFFIAGGSLKKIPSSGGKPLRICDDCETPYGAAWDEPDRILVAGQNGIYSVSPEGGTKRELTKLDAEGGEKAHRSPQSLPGGRILFSIIYADKVRFAVLDPETGEKTMIEGLEGESSSHGGTSLAVYVEQGFLLFARSGQLMAVKFDPSTGRIEGEPKPMMEGLFAIANIQVAESGTLIFLPEADLDENLLVWVDRKGVSAPVFDKRGDYRSPHLSPDGSKIAVQVGSDIWVYEIESGRGTRLTFRENNQAPLWSPDGKFIYYAANSGELWKIYRKQSDGGGNAEELFSSENRHLPYSIHPTEPVLALSNVPAANNSDIVLLSIPDRKLTPFITTPFKEDAPKISPDGRTVAYFSMETGRVQVFLQPWEGFRGGKTTVSETGGMLPVWSRNGKELFFRSGQKLLSAPIESSADGASAGKSNFLFEGRYLTGFDVSSDGERFLMVRSEGGTMPKRLNVVLNWAPELLRSETGNDR